MRKFLFTLAALVGATLAFAAPAMAWTASIDHVTVDCSDGETSYDVTLSDQGTGDVFVYVDDVLVPRDTSRFDTTDGDSLSDGFVTPANGSHVLRIVIDYDEAETLTITREFVVDCEVPTTTTTVPVTTTTTQVYTSPPPSVPAPPVQAPPAPELPNTGGLEFGVAALVAVAFILAGLALAGRKDA